MISRFFLILITVLLSVSCTTPLKPDLTVSDHMIYPDVPLRPGAVAWSPDSSRIAVITGADLSIFDPEAGKKLSVPGINPLFIDWSPGENLLLVHNERGRNELAQVSPIDGTINSVPLDDIPVAAKWLNPPDDFIVLFHDVERYSIGAFVSYKYVALFNGREEQFLKWGTYLPTHNPDIDAVSGWTFSGIRPVHGSVITPEYHNPPRMPPFTLLKTVDPVISEEREITMLDSARYSVPSSWSPDGSRLAVTNDQGQLIVIDINNPEDLQPANDDARGLYPSWNPKGSQIYLGGWLMKSDGAVLEQIISDASESIGIWSPDGTRLVVLHEDELLYFEGFLPTYNNADRPMDERLRGIRDKIRFMKDLLKEGLIPMDEFKVRRSGYFKKNGSDEK